MIVVNSFNNQGCLTNIITANGLIQFYFCTANVDSKIQLPKYEANIGALVILSCDSNRKTEWYYGNTSTEPIAFSPNLIRHRVNSEDTGLYYCFGTLGDNITYFLARTILKVYGILLLLLLLLLLLPSCFSKIKQHF